MMCTGRETERYHARGWTRPRLSWQGRIRMLGSAEVGVAPIILVEKAVVYTTMKLFNIKIGKGY